MKTAIYIQDGDTQLVLTPETQWEESVITAIETGGKSVQILRGSFYETRGGWMRQGQDDKSLIIRTSIKAKDGYGIELTQTNP